MPLDPATCTDVLATGPAADYDDPGIVPDEDQEQPIMKTTVRLATAVILLAAGISVCAPTSWGEEKRAYPAIGTIERLDPRFD